MDTGCLLFLVHVALPSFNYSVTVKAPANTCPLGELNRSGYGE